MSAIDGNRSPDVREITVGGCAGAESRRPRPEAFKKGQSKRSQAKSMQSDQRWRRTPEKMVSWKGGRRDGKRGLCGVGVSEWGSWPSGVEGMAVDCMRRGHSVNLDNLPRGWAVS